MANSAAEKAHDAAVKEIRRVREAGETAVDLSDERYRALDRIPQDIATVTALQTLDLTRTAVSDLAPLAGLVDLTDLVLDGCQVADLRPIRGCAKLGTEEPIGLSFRDTLATVADGTLARLARIEDTEGRARETLAYLNTLPPWPEPCTPRERPDDQPQQPIGQASEPVPLVPALRTPEAQVGALLRHALVTRVTASMLAEHIASALRRLPASEGNQLPPILQLMSEVGRNWASHLVAHSTNSQGRAMPDRRAGRQRQF